MWSQKRVIASVKKFLCRSPPLKATTVAELKGLRVAAAICADREHAPAVISAAAGRMRVQATSFRNGPLTAVAIEDAVSQVPGVRAVHAYPRTASVVIWYSVEQYDGPAILAAIATAQRIPAAAVPARAPRQLVNDGCCDHDASGPEPHRLRDVVKVRRAALSGALLTASAISAWVAPLGPLP